MITETLRGTTANSDLTAAADALHRLIHCCHAGERGFRAAASIVQDDLLRKVFTTYSLQRARFAAELQTEIARWKDLAFETAIGANRSSYDLDADPTVEPLDHCRDQDEALLQRYEEALQAKLPRSAHFLLSAQFALVRQAHPRVCALSRRREETANATS